MPQMSKLRKKLGGWELVNIENYNDVSYMTQWEIQNIGGVAYSYWDYISRGGRTCRKVVKGHWTLNKSEGTLDKKQLKKLLNLMNPVFNETKNYKTDDKKVEVMRKLITIVKDSR